MNDCGYCINERCCYILGKCLYTHELLKEKRDDINAMRKPNGKIRLRTLLNFMQTLKNPKVSGKQILINSAKKGKIYHPIMDSMTNKNLKKVLKGKKDLFTNS